MTWAVVQVVFLAGTSLGLSVYKLPIGDEQTEAALGLSGATQA